MQEQESVLPGQEPWTPAACLHLLLSVLGWVALTGVALFMAGALVRSFLPPPVVARWQSPVTFIALEAVWLLVLSRYGRRGGVKPLWRGEELRDLRTWLLLGGAVSLCIGSSLLRIWLAEGSLGLSAADLAGLGPVQWGPAFAVLGATAGLAPIAEEWLFRGIIQEALSRHWGPGLSILVTSLVFGALHGLTDMWVIAGYGLVFGYLAHRRRSLTLPILVHACVNLVAMGVPLAMGYAMSGA